MVRSTQTVHQYCVKISTISKRTETSFHLSLVTSGTIRCVQMIFEPMVRLAQTMHLSCIDTNTVSKWKGSEIPHDTRHLGVPSGASKFIYDLVVCSSQTVHLTCIRISTMFERPKRASTRALSPVGTIECVQNDF